MSPLIIKYCELIEMGAIGDTYIFKYYLNTIYGELMDVREFVSKADKNKYKDELALVERVWDIYRKGMAKLESMERDKQLLPRNLNKCPSCNGCGKIIGVFDNIIDCNDDFHKCKGCGNIKDGINFLCEKCFDI